MKKSVLLLVCVCLAAISKAQFQFDIGATWANSASKVQNFMRPVTLIGTTIRDTFYYAYNVSASGYGVYAYPKYHLKQVANHTISLGAPIMLGFAGSANSQLGSTFHFMYDFNVAVDINGGRLNRQQDYPDKPYGYFAGIGFGILNTDGFKYDGGRDNSVNEKTKDLVFIPEGGYVDEYMTAKASGLLFHAGVVAPFMFHKDNSKSMGLRFFVKPGLGKSQLTYYGLSAYFSVSNDRGY
jgi:hypothetical protein